MQFARVLSLAATFCAACHGSTVADDDDWYGSQLDATASDVTVPGTPLCTPGFCSTDPAFDGGGQVACDPTAQDPCPVKDGGNACAEVLCDPTKLVCVALPVTPPPRQCPGWDGGGAAVDASIGLDAGPTGDATDAASE
jgi:hypothetical protein